MKKILVFLLLSAVICITGCNNADSNVSDDGSDSVSSTEVSDVSSVFDTDSVSVDDSSAEVIESSADPYEGWTLVFGDIYIPDFPFEDWGGQNQDNISCYTIFIRSNNSAAFHSYVQSLTDFGYTIEKINGYSYKGTDPQNRSIHFTDHENGQMQIAIYY